MTVTLSEDARSQALASLKRYCAQELEQEISDVQVYGLLAFFLKEIAPSVYNGAVADAQAFLRDRLADLEATCYEPEFTYWPKGTSVRRKL
jgi:uncharacterized protein (DUF2164 family)